MKAYHFVGKRLRDGRKIPANGVKLVHTGYVDICYRGLHASKTPFDALQYAPGATLCLVECNKIIQEHADKLVCRERTIIKRFDATALLSYFTRTQALSVSHLWDCPDVVLTYLLTGNKRAAARDAAWAAARYAAWAAARYAAWGAAGHAAWAAARYAAWAAAWAAACAAARAAAWDAARKEFNTLVCEEFDNA